MINVLVVDDSRVVREHLKDILESDKAIRVVGMAGDGEEAVRFVDRKSPHVITMDINMPRMNGLVATRRIMETKPVPIVVVSASYSRGDVRKSFLAMEAGAVAITEKPVGPKHPDYVYAVRELIQTVKLMSEIKVVRRLLMAKPSGEARTATPEIKPEQIQKSVKLVAIGASTGGPPVLHTVLSGLKQGFRFPVVVVQHISAGFLGGMVDWLGQAIKLPVHIAAHGEKLLPGHVYFASDGFHAGIGSGGRIKLSRSEPENGVRPSVSYLFRSAMSVYGGDMVGVLLTGMGKDGAEELKEMKEKGAVTIVQDKETSVVYGMPGEAVRLGAAAYVLSPDRISAMLESLAKAGIN